MLNAYHLVVLVGPVEARRRTTRTFPSLQWESPKQRRLLFELNLFTWFYTLIYHGRHRTFIILFNNIPNEHQRRLSWLALTGLRNRAEHILIHSLTWFSGQLCDLSSGECMSSESSYPQCNKLVTKTLKNWWGAVTNCNSEALHGVSNPSAR